MNFLFTSYLVLIYASDNSNKEISSPVLDNENYGEIHLNQNVVDIDHIYEEVVDIDHSNQEPINHIYEEPINHLNQEPINHLNQEPINHLNQEPIEHLNQEPIDHIYEEVNQDEMLFVEIRNYEVEIHHPIIINIRDRIHYAEIIEIQEDSNPSRKRRWG